MVSERGCPQVVYSVRIPDWQGHGDMDLYRTLFWIRGV